MAHIKQFIKQLDDQFQAHTSWLRTSLGKKRPGRRPKMTRAKVAKALQKLEILARKIIVEEQAKREFRKAIECSPRWHPKKNKGWDRNAKKINFGRWYEKRIKKRHSVYVFWNGRRCLYVGRTINGRQRPQSHFSKHWFNQATRIDVHIIRTASQVHKVECLAMDRWRPRYNRNKSSRGHYLKSCPICSLAKEIREELKSWFRLRD